MFTKVISRCSFTSGQANEIFNHTISGPAFNSDLSFLAVMRALLSKRIANGEVAKYSFRAIDASSANLASDRAALLRAMHLIGDESQIIIRALGGSDEYKKRFFERIDERKELHEGCRELMDVRAYISCVVNARFFVDDKTRQTIIIVETLDIRQFHLLAAFIPRYAPWWFDDALVDDFEANLLKSLTRKTPTDFENLIEEAYRRANIRELIIKNIIGGFERRSRQAEIDIVTEEIAGTYRQIDSNMEAYRELIRELDALNVRILGLKAAMENASDSGELCRYFSANKSLIPISVNGSQLKFVVRTYLDLIDPDMYESVMANRHSYLHEDDLVDSAEFRDPADQKRLLDALFSSEPLFRAKICAYYELNIRGNVGSYTHYRFPEECNDCIPNPHLNYNNCLGDYRRYIIDAVKRGDTIGAIEQCVASARSMNINESASARYFIRDLMDGYRHKKVIELPDGTSMTPVEALEWLKKKEEEAESIEH